MKKRTLLTLLCFYTINGSDKQPTKLQKIENCNSEISQPHLKALPLEIQNHIHSFLDQSVIEIHSIEKLHNTYEKNNSSKNLWASSKIGSNKNGEFSLKKSQNWDSPVLKILAIEQKTLLKNTITYTFPDLNPNKPIKENEIQFTVAPESNTLAYVNPYGVYLLKLISDKKSLSLVSRSETSYTYKRENIEGSIEYSCLKEYEPSTTSKKPSAILFNKATTKIGIVYDKGESSEIINIDSSNKKNKLRAYFKIIGVYYKLQTN